MLTHFKGGKATMVDVSDKPASVRQAVAESRVRLPSAVLEALQQGSDKGDPIAVAELAGIMAAKRTGELIPLCHPLPLSSVSVQGELDAGAAEVRFVASCKTAAQTGVEMEALTAASIAALTLYDMLKAAGKGMSIHSVRLLFKEGGRSGPWHASSSPEP